MSDSASFDEVVELLVHAGRSLPHAVLMMIPEAWERSTGMSPERRAFYRYHAGLMEPWDGPASVTFCDGTVAGAVLDRNGLRPARYWSQKIIASSSRAKSACCPSILRTSSARVACNGPRVPGRRGARSHYRRRGAEVLSRGGAPYGEWLDRHQLSLDAIDVPEALTPEYASVVRLQKSFGYSEEDLRMIMRHMAQVGEEPVGSMGSDTTLPVLSSLPRSIFDYFSHSSPK